MRRIRGRHCPDCGAALVYYPHLSSPRAPEGQRVLVYSCPECTDDFERPRMVAVRPDAGGGADDAAPIESVDVVITERAPSPVGGNARGGDKSRNSPAKTTGQRNEGDGG